MIYIATDNFNDGFPLSNAYDDTIYQKANGEYYLKFRFPVDRLGVWKHLTCETVLKADDTRGLQLFKIKKINKINGYIRVYAKHISDDLNFISVDKIAVNNATGRRVMEALAGSTTEQHSFIFDSDIATMHTLNLSNTTAGKVLSKDKHSILGQWGGELIRDNFLIDLKSRAGVDTEILFMNKKNVKNLDNAISTENLTTRLKLTVEKEHEGKKQIITATVDSPNINAYPRIYTNYLRVNNNNIETQQQLIEYGTKYFKDSLVDFPTDNLTVNVIDKNQEQISLFDTVWFRNVDFNIDKRLKVVAYEYSPMAKRYKKISFGALKVANLSQIKSLSQLEEKIDEKITESFTDAFKIQQNLSQLLKLDRKDIEDKLVELEEKSKGALEVKKALFEADGTIPEVVKTKILDAVEGEIGRLKTIITEAELIKAIQAKLNYAEIKNALIDKAFINQIISDEKFTQQFEDGEVTTQNIFTKLKDSIKSNISKEFMTKEGVKKLVNDLTIDADGIRQITQQESVKVFENKKQELKGVNAYLHKKYSDFEDGRNMSDNSTLKYIGIYTGDKEQAPTSASEYNWTKIKGEDGKSINRNYIVDSKNLNFKNFGSWGKWEKSVSEDILILTKVGGSDTTGFFLVLTDLVKTQFQNEELTWSIDIKGSRNATFSNVGFETNGKQQVDITTNWQRISHTFINKFIDYYGFVFYNPTTNFNNGDKIYIRLPKLEKGNVATEWSPAYEDLQAHSLTANLRFEGRYINSVVTNLNTFIDVFYDGQKITEDFELKVKHKGMGITNWTDFISRPYDNTGKLTNFIFSDGEKDGTPLEAILLVTYKGLNTIANARLENIPDVVEIKEITKKYKTFESTINRFNSTIGEVKQQVLANEEKRNLVLGSRMISESDYTQMGKSVNLMLSQAYEGFPYLSVYSHDQTSKIWQGVGFKLSISKISKGETYSIRIPVFFGRSTDPDEGSYLEIKNHNTQQVLWRTRLDLDKYKQGKWNVHECKFTATRDLDLGNSSFWIYHVKNGFLAFAKPYMCAGDTLPKNYSPAPEDVYLQNSRLESSITQTKNEIDLKVSKDNVINSINISGEGTKITGTAIADYLYGKTIEGATIQGNSKIKLGQHGFLQPIEQGLQINAPASYNANNGVGFQIHGYKKTLSNGNTIPKGAFIYKDDDFSTGGTASTSNETLLTVEGMIYCRSMSDRNGKYHSGYAVPTITTFNANGSGLYPIFDIYHQDDYRGAYFNYSVPGKYFSVATKAISDVRFKKNIKQSKENALRKIDMIDFKAFDWKEKGKGHEKLGMIAQELEKIESKFVDLITFKDGEERYMLNTDILNIYSLKAIQELSQENTNLRSQLKEMNERLQKLEDKINGNI